MEPERARALVGAFAGRRVLVIGDLMLDRYLWGDVERISPEAPVPVVRLRRESSMLGGAGNVARNLASLGASVEVAGVAGEDEPARELRALFDQWKIDAAGMLVDPTRPTTEKTRVIARAQQVVRFDREVEEPIGEDSAARLLARVVEAAERVEGAILQDYGKGLLAPDLVVEIMAGLGRRGVPVFVDPKAPPWERYRGAALLKPNLREAEAATGLRAREGSDLEAIGRRALERSGARMVAITRGESGVTLFPADGPTRHVPTRPRAVSDVAGAGDTAIAVLALARLAGAEWTEAAEMANAAAGVVVGIPGTATLSPADLLGALGTP